MLGILCVVCVCVHYVHGCINACGKFYAVLSTATLRINCSFQRMKFVLSLYLIFVRGVFSTFYLYRSFAMTKTTTSHKIVRFNPSHRIEFIQCEWVCVRIFLFLFQYIFPHYYSRYTNANIFTLQYCMCVCVRVTSPHYQLPIDINTPM